MNIREYKAQFEAAMLPLASLPTGAAEQAWNYFKNSMREDLDENYLDEFGFSVGIRSYFDGVATVHYVENQFSVYFGRLIDADPSRSWSVAEIDCWFVYEMNDELHLLIHKIQDEMFAIENDELHLLIKEVQGKKFAIEVDYRSTDDAEIIRRKREAVFAFADGKKGLWNAVRNLKPIRVQTQFWLR